MYCNQQGEIINWDDWNCKGKGVTTEAVEPATEPEYLATAKAPPIYHTTAPQIGGFGCYHNGNHYHPGEAISKGYDKESDWCYGMYCSDRGEIINWDDWNCKGKAATTEVPRLTTGKSSPVTPAPLRTERRTLPPTTTGTCYHGGRSYQPGETISEHYDKDSDLCYGKYCNHAGAVISWDDWNCKQGKGAKGTTERPVTSVLVSFIISIFFYYSFVYIFLYRLIFLPVRPFNYKDL